MEIDAALRRIRFSVAKPKGDREHYLTFEQICTLLKRLPLDVWSRLRGVHFNDRSWGARVLGYVNGGRR
jgi:hypothetical protein